MTILFSCTLAPDGASQGRTTILPISGLQLSASGKFSYTSHNFDDMSNGCEIEPLHFGDATDEVITLVFTKGKPKEL